MTSPTSSPNINLNFDLIESVLLRDGEATNENDSGVFSDTTVNTQLPIYLTKHGKHDSKSSRKFHAPNTKNPVRRLVRKSGKPNVIRRSIPYFWTAYIRDIGNTLVNSRWRWTMLCFASSYIFSWLLFAWFYMLIARDNNDVAETDPSKTPCLMGIAGFAGYFLFSIETQHTIGYGSRYITSNCPEGTFLVCLQVIMGVALCGAMASIVYTKMVRPHAPHSKALFSKTAVICQRDGILCLIFRVRDDSNRHQIGTSINAYLVQSRGNEPFLKLLCLERSGLLLWPLEVVHFITPSSPFWDLSAKDLITRSFELIVTMHGTSPATGQCSKTRTSFLTSEILWGHRFKPCIKFDNEKQSYYVDSADFNTTEEILTPLCSAQRLYEVVQEISSPYYSPYSVKSPTISRYGRSSNTDSDSLRNSSGIGSMIARSSNTDTDSLRNSSGIGSMRDELITPINTNDIDKVVLRKLSTIREFNSTENLKSGATKEHPVDVDASIVEVDVPSSTDSGTPDNDKWDRQVDSYVEDINEKMSQIDNAKARHVIRNSGIFDVESLIVSLQNYLEETEGVKVNDKKDFCETNF